MAQHPLIIFPAPAEATRSDLTQDRRRPEVPPHARHIARLAPRFEALQLSFAEPGQQAQESLGGADPDRVIVLETVGSVQDFAGAVRRIEGMGWLGEFMEDHPADEDFVAPPGSGPRISGRVYLILSNQQALRQLLSLWNRYQANPGADFSYGLAPFKEVFRCLYDVRRWDARDRLAETGVLEYWREMLAEGTDPIWFEAEFWFYTEPAQRARAFRSFSEAVQQSREDSAATLVTIQAAYRRRVGSVARIRGCGNRCAARTAPRTRRGSHVLPAGGSVRRADFSRRTSHPRPRH